MRAAAAVADRHPDIITRSGVGQAGALDITWTTAVEFDGMLRCDMQITPREGAANLQGLKMTVPVAGDAGGYGESTRG